MKPRLILIWGALAAGICVDSVAQAQYQTSLQVQPQVNTGLYGPYTNPSTLRYGSQNAVNNPLLPSQERFLIVQSGLLPSQIRAGQMAAGPLAPGGITAALNPASPLQQATAPQASPNGPLAADMSAPQSSLRYSPTAAPVPNVAPPAPAVLPSSVRLPIPPRPATTAPSTAPATTTAPASPGNR